MFLAFPLDFQTKGFVSQAVRHFGHVVTWTSNNRCKSRVLVRCAVTLMSRIPRSLIICLGTQIGAGARSWAVPVYVLNSQLNDEQDADEDPIPPDGNPHPVNGPFFPGYQPEFQAGLDDVGVSNEVNQINIDHGWEPNQNPPPVAQFNPNDWPAWPEQEGEVVDENELAQVQQLAADAVVNAMQQQLAQHPAQPQSTESISSTTRSFFRPQGPPITMEVPLRDCSELVILCRG